ncbi:PKD domain-containing protein [Nocardioides sp. CPCC 205120]|uniref:PKD domain-containing protein n=1 Tax=Nocardioides sp. CPCC 205120 TaxID=3406462 RepID=UPI003B500DA3
MFGDCQAPVACSGGETSDISYVEVLAGGGDFQSECEPAAAAAAAPVITPALVLQAFQSVPLPETVLTIQPPDGLTLVNFDTNFYTEAAPFTTTVTLLGQAVELDITPTSYTWNYGDGTTVTTSTPGAPYPDLEVTHRYQQAGSYQVTVTTTWSARYRVNGGPWLDVAGTVTMPSAPVPLQVDEATPILTD